MATFITIILLHILFTLPPMIRADTIEAFNCAILTNSTNYILPPPKNCTLIFNEEEAEINIINFKRYQPTEIIMCKHEIKEVIDPITKDDDRKATIIKNRAMSYEDCKFLSEDYPRIAADKAITRVEISDSPNKYEGTNFYIDSNKYGHQDVFVQIQEMKSFHKVNVTVDTFENIFVPDEKFNCSIQDNFCKFNNNSYIWSTQITHRNCSNIAPISSTKIIRKFNTKSKEYSYIASGPNRLISFQIPTTKIITLCNEKYLIMKNNTLLSVKSVKNDNNSTSQLSENDITILGENFQTFTRSEYANSIENVEDRIQYKKCMKHNENLIDLKKRLSNEKYIITSDVGKFLTRDNDNVKILQCKKFMAKLDTTSKCFDAIPILYNRGTYFISGSTRILQKEAQRIPCDKHNKFSFMVNNTLQYIHGGKWTPQNHNFEELDLYTLKESSASNIDAFTGGVFHPLGTYNDIIDAIESGIFNTLYFLHLIIINAGSYAAFIFLIIFSICWIKKRFDI